MIAYVKVELSLYGLRERSLADVLSKLKSALEPEFGERSENDIEISVIESAGEKEN